MSGAKQQKPGGGDPIIAALIAAGCLYLGYEVWPGPDGDDAQRLIAAGLLLFGAWSTVKVFIMLRARYRAIALLVRALRPGDDFGSAGWMSERELRRSKLHLSRSGSSFVGVVGTSPLFLWTETHCLIIAPTGSGKSTTVIALRLASNETNALVSDIKGELSQQFADFRARKFGKRAIIHNPTDPNSAHFNPLDVIYALVMENSPDALTWVRGMVKQLYPEPPQEGANRFFRDGARVDITTLILAVIVACPPETRTLGTVYRAIIDETFMNDLLLQAARCELLGGEISMMADDMHRMAFSDDSTAKTFEQFRMGAALRMEVFGPGGHLARVSARSDFSFTDLKTDNVDIYLSVDFRNSEVLGPWVGLLQWFAAQQLVAVGNNKPVEFIFDEFCNAPVRQLPKILTLLRSYGVKVTMATQDLSDIKRVYGEDALETILSETNIKQFLAGIRSKRTLEYIANALGEETVIVSSFSQLDATPQESISLRGRKLKNFDEIRRLDSNAQIIIYDNENPIFARKLPVFAIAPYRKEINPNTMYGGTLRLDPVMVRMTRQSAKVFKRGYWDIPKKRNLRPLFWSLLSAFLPSSSVFVVLFGLAFVYWAGFPYVLTHYSASAYGEYRTYHECHYWGPSPFVIRGDCPLFKLKKVW